MSPVRIFVIDDSAVIRQIIGRVIENHPHCLLAGSAPTIADAREAIATLQPDVVTLDLAMPGADGLTYLEELNAQGHPPVVVVSASTRPGAPETLRALVHGAEACFDKARIVTDASLFIRTLTLAARRRSSGSRSAA
jgi:chemotaxis response regulator CheB